MRLRLRGTGGLAYIPAFERQVEVDTADLPPAKANLFEELARSAEERAASSPPRGHAGADRREYHLTIEDDDGTRSLTMQDPIHDRAFAALVEHLYAHQEGTSP